MRAELRDITVDFGNLRAVDGVTLEFSSGEIHALVGENGAGKSTVISVLFGLNKAYTGQISINGRDVAWRSPKDAIEAGIGMVHQHFMLQESMSVLENAILGAEPIGRLGYVDFDQARPQLKELAADYGFQLDLDRLVADLSVGERQMVEILKALYRNSRILILDEPTAVLTPSERDNLFDTLRQFKDDGKSIVLITHKIDEVMAAADRVSVMRAGRLVASSPLGDTSHQAISRQIVGGELPSPLVRKDASIGEPALEIIDLVVPGTAPNPRPMSLSVKKGEIVGLAGVSGNGQAELVQAIVGLRHVRSGRIVINGKEATFEDVAGRRQAGLSYIPEDRQRTGLALDASVAENACVSQIGDPSFSTGGFLRHDSMKSYAASLIERFSIKVHGPDATVSTMSGGNKQKLVVARELSLETPVIIVENPTWGVDIGAISFIHEQIMAMREAQHAILLISTELDEILALSDRIFVMFEGGLSDEIAAADASGEVLGKLMLTEERRDKSIN